MIPKTQAARTALATQNELVIEWSRQLASPAAQVVMRDTLTQLLAPVTDVIVALFDKKETS